MEFPAEPEKRAFFSSFMARATELIETNGIKPNPTEVSHGLEAIPAGWKRLRVSQLGMPRMSPRS
jgi:hypothetical protein